MYLALLLATLTLVVDSFSTLRLILWLTLLIDLIVKLSYEERLLVAAWDEYHGYMKKTKRLIPFLF
jgi:protein-S-isoprenylcysteine O-methyltransferase Ste14